jgi:hypothetical protein
MNGGCLNSGMTFPRQLTDREFKRCFAEPMTNVTGTATPAVDIWPYVESLNLNALGLPSLNEVRHVYRDGLGRYDQVLIGTGRFNALLVIIVDLSAKAVLGHFLVDLNKEYGLEGGHLRAVR